VTCALRWHKACVMFWPQLLPCVELPQVGRHLFQQGC
jgi:hypothetical protein